MSSAAGIPVAPDELVDDFAAAIIELGSATVPLARLLELWDRADRGWAATTGGRVRLADALQRLEGAGLVRLPSPRGSRWDSALPRLPTSISVPLNRRPRRTVIDPTTELWVPALSWAGSWMRSSRPPQRLRQTLVVVNRWLAGRTGMDVEVIGREERSLEVFDDEKVLAQLIGSVLFAPGRLTLELLRCEPPLGGLRVARTAEAGPVLVLENKAIFDSAVRALRARAAAGGPVSYAAVIFGGGDHAESLVPDLCSLEDLLGVKASLIDYAGDIDVAGIAAADAFLTAARSAGLAARPAVRLWERLSTETPVGDDLTGDDREHRDAVAASLRLGLPSGVTDHLRERARVPQERLTRTTLADTSWWEPE